MSDASTLATAIDVHDWLERDQTTSPAERAQRDTQIGARLLGRNAFEQVTLWWSDVGAVAENSLGVRTARLRAWTGAGLFTGGALLGSSVASVALTYDGQHPVNLLILLGVLVGIPLFFLLLTLISLALHAAHLTRLSERLSAINVSRLASGWWVQATGMRSVQTQPAARSLLFWQFTAFAQVFSVGFFVAALATVILTIAVSDVAFGWSTTLQLEPDTVNRWVQAIALPWSAWLPAAVPDYALVATSQFYRLETDVLSTRAARLGDWWPFVVMTVTVWGLLPRVVLLLLAAIKVGRGEKRMLIEHPLVTALLDRMQSDRLPIPVGDPADPRPVPRGASPGAVRPAIAEGTLAINWNGASRSPPDGSISLSILQSQDDLRDQIRQAGGPFNRVVIYTKAWEPPILEFADFVELVRTEVGPAPPVAIVPLPLDVSQPSARDHAVWHDAILRLNDPHTYVADVDTDSP